VIRERTMPVDLLDRGQQRLHVGDLVRCELTLDVETAHCPEGTEPGGAGRSLLGMATAVVDRFDGEVPRALEDLVTLPGVGRKTANVVRSVAFDLPGLPVDTHVGRLSRRLGLTTEQDPVKVELVLNSYLPPSDWGAFSLRLILHGRRVCDAKRPRCGDCVLERLCPSSRLFWKPGVGPAT